MGSGFVIAGFSQGGQSQDGDIAGAGQLLAAGQDAIHHLIGVAGDDAEFVVAGHRHPDRVIAVAHPAHHPGLAVENAAEITGVRVDNVQGMGQHHRQHKKKFADDGASGLGQGHGSGHRHQPVQIFDDQQHYHRNQQQERNCGEHPYLANHGEGVAVQGDQAVALFHQGGHPQLLAQGQIDGGVKAESHHPRQNLQATCQRKAVEKVVIDHQGQGGGDKEQQLQPEGPTHPVCQRQRSDQSAVKGSAQTVLQRQDQGHRQGYLPGGQAFQERTDVDPVQRNHDQGDQIMDGRAHGLIARNGLCVHRGRP